jgi:flavin reductase (DIM6/NTAB) family NADH-FMN oxidoreductase RutF
MVGEAEFRRVMGHFATGVTVVASRTQDDKPVGLTVNAFTSVSLSPPLVLVCVHREAEPHDPILESGHFGVSVLTGGQKELALRFAREEPEHRFEGLYVVPGSLGSPLIRGSHAWLECRIEKAYPGGDHTIILGEVVDCGPGLGDPLLFHRGSLMGLAR